MYGDLIYICTPFEEEDEKKAGWSDKPWQQDQDNRKKAELLADQIDMAKRQCEYVLQNGGIPIAPHLWVQLLRQSGLPIEEDLLKVFVREMIGACDELMVVGPQKTNFMQFEIDTALRENVSVSYCPDSRELREEDLDRKWRAAIRKDMEKEGLIWGTPEPRVWDDDYDGPGDYDDGYYDYD